MAAVGKLLLSNGIAVAEQNRAAGTRSLNPHRPATQHIRTIGMEGDSSESLRFTLGAQHAAAGIKPLKGTVVVGVDAAAGFQNKSMFRRLINGQPAVGAAIVRCRQVTTVNGNVEQFKLNTPQSQRLIDTSWLQLHPCLDQDKCVLDIHVQLNCGELKSPGGVVRQTDRGSSSHAGSEDRLTRS